MSDVECCRVSCADQLAESNPTVAERFGRVTSGIALDILPSLNAARDLTVEIMASNAFRDGIHVPARH